jgi:linoleoyl-CoA desaturase
MEVEMITVDLQHNVQVTDASPGLAPTPTAVPKIRFQQGNHSDFYRTVKARVRRYLTCTGRTRFADYRVALKVIGCFAVSAGAYGLILSGAFNVWGMLVLANVYGIASLLLALSVGHDAAHDAVFVDRRLNRLAQFLCFCLLGADPYLWRLRHVKSHHVFPNVNGCDIDIDSNMFLRLSPNHHRRWYHRFQHVYAPIIFWLVDIHTVFIQDFHYLFKRRLANLVDIRHTIGAYVSFIGCKLIYISIVFLVPLLVLPLPWWQVLIGALVMSFVASCLFVYLLIGTHFAEETVFPEVAADGSIGHDWAIHAMITSLDWSPYSRIAQFLSGGANAHAAHHLFPNVCHIHYVAITRIIARAAREYGVTHNVTTLPRMVRSHFRFLKAMGSIEERPPLACPVVTSTAAANVVPK